MEDMLTERPIHNDLKEALIDNRPLEYAHLIKFERPSRLEKGGVASTSKERYTYITDGSRNVKFDDKSTDIEGNRNGTQVYLANKVLQVSSVAEQTEARADNYSLVLDGNGIGAAASADVTITQINEETWDIVWPQDVNLVNRGFREGDKVELEGLCSGSYNIYRFRENNTLRIKKIDTRASTGTGTLNMSLASEEIKSILLNKNSEDYASFINREVFIYRAYFDNNKQIDGPFLLFKGIVSNVSFDEKDSGIEVTWGLTSHWGDFSQVKGRITSDDFHRALDENGIPQPQSALKPAYAYDKGFSHSETSINILSKYTVQVEKQDVKVKKGFLGIGSKVKVKSHTVPEERNTELDFQLEAKSLPVIYGVRETQGIPVFADTQNDDSSIVYTIYALSEGEIGGLYDTYIGGNSLICNDKADFDTRSTQTDDNTVQLVCRGRADRGDVLSGESSEGSAEDAKDYYSDSPYLFTGLNYNYNLVTNYTPYVAPTVTVNNPEGRGVIHGESIKLSDPQNITIDVFSGRSGQRADSQLVEIAATNNFKIQNDYWLNRNTSEYWGPNHRLLDTAYVAVKTVIAEGETTLPELTFIVRGKAIECFNYDYSYSHYTKNSSESSSNFKLGSFVDLFDSNGNKINSNTQIVDKWSFYNPDGTSNTRFIFDQVPNLDYVEGVPGITKFYMQSNSHKWTMITHNYIEYKSGVAKKAATKVTSISDHNGYVSINYDPVTHMGPGYGGAYIDHNLPRLSLRGLDIR